MNTWLKFTTVAFPIPSIYWVVKGDHPKWIKAISGFWTAFYLLMLFGYAKSPEGIAGFPDFIIFSLIVFGVINGLLALCKKAFDSAKNTQTKLQKSTTDFEPKISVQQRRVKEPQPTSTSPETQQIVNEEEKLTPRRERALYNLANKILEDDVVDLVESKKLHAWFKRYPESKEDLKTKELATTVELCLEDKVLDNDEALHLFALLTDFCDGFEEREQANQKPTKKPAPKSGKRISLVASSNLSFLNELELDAQYFMSYKDSAGKVSEREIVLRKIEQNASGDTYIKAFCLMRDSVRTFRADRITSICSVETGEAFV